jgi:hypothetical protein
MVRSRSVFVATVCVVALLVAGPPARAQQIAGSLSNFDVRNVDDSQKYNDFELLLLGKIDSDCIKGFYPGWGAPPAVRAGTPFGSGLTITWRNLRDPIGPGRSEHFDSTCAATVRSPRGFWSVDGKPAREVVLPWQSWQMRPGALWDIIELPRELEIAPVPSHARRSLCRGRASLERLNWMTLRSSFAAADASGAPSTASRSSSRPLSKPC